MSVDGTGLSGRTARLQCVTLLLENGAGANGCQTLRV